MSDLLPITLQEEIAELEREIGLRRRVYPNFVRSGRLKQAKADRQIAVMESAIRRLTTLAEQRPDVWREIEQAVMQLQDNLPADALETLKELQSKVRQT